MKAGLSIVIAFTGALFLSSVVAAESVTTMVELEQKAAAGDLDAKMKLAERYYKGEGLRRIL